MPSDEIGARLSLKDRPQFSSDAERAASDVRKLGDTTDHATRRGTTGFVRMRGAFGGFYSRVTGGMGVLLGAAGIGGLVVGIKGVVDSATSLQKITTQTTAVLKSTGGAANITAKQVRGLANEINGYSLIDDDVVQGGENMLLTFTKVRNEVGKGNDIFNQATKTAADMSTALGGDMKQSALQLGKALNDPIKGVGALRRVGVAFDDQQTKQITHMVKHNNTLGAQKLILQELQKEFGGSAKAAGTTFAGALFHLKDSLQDTARDMLMPALPALTKGVNAIATQVGPKFTGWLKGLRHEFNSNGPGIKTTATAIGTVLWGALKTVYHFITGSVIPAAEDLWHVVGPLLIEGAHKAADAIKRLSGFLDGAGKVLKGVTGFMSDHATMMRALIVVVVAGYSAWKIWTTAIKVWQAVTKIATGVQAAFNVVMDANPIMLVVIAIAALAAGLVYAWHHSETFRNVVTGVFHAVVGAAKAVFNWLKENWPYLLPILLGPFGLVVGVIIKHWGKIMDFFKAVPGHVGRFFSGVADVILAPFEWVFNKIADAWNNTAGRLSFHAPGWIPHFGGKGWSMPKIPHWGGASYAAENAPAPTAYAPGMSRLHQGGTTVHDQYVNLKPSEEIVHLPDGTTVIPLNNDDIREIFGDGGEDGSMVAVLELDGKTVAEAVFKHAKRKAARK